MGSVGWGEIVLIALLALVLLGPDRLPRVAKQAAGWLRRARELFADTKQTVERELGTTLPDSLDPRAIVRAALAEPESDVAGPAAMRGSASDALGGPDTPPAGASGVDGKGLRRGEPASDPRSIIRDGLGLTERD